MKQHLDQHNYGLADANEVYRLVYTMWDPNVYAVIKVYEDPCPAIFKYQFEAMESGHWETVSNAAFNVRLRVVDQSDPAEAVAALHERATYDGWELHHGMSQFEFMSGLSPRPRDLGLRAYGPTLALDLSDTDPVRVEIRTQDGVLVCVEHVFNANSLGELVNYFPSVGVDNTTRHTPESVDDLRVRVDIDTTTFQQAMQELEDRIGEVRRVVSNGLAPAMEGLGVMAEAMVAGSMSVDEFSEAWDDFNDSLQHRPYIEDRENVVWQQTGQTIENDRVRLHDFRVAHAAGPQAFYTFLVAQAKHADTSLGFSVYIDRFLKLWNPEQIGYKVFDQRAQEIKRRVERERRNRARREQEAKSQTRARHLELP
jgi:hypothetical protein